MPLETATYINQLNSANPLGSDPIAAGDDHIRLIKSALQATFPALTGPVTVSQSVINNPFPVGGIILWSGAISAVPAGWALCDGTNGTPNLRDRFVVGAGTTYAVGATGGSASTTLVEANLPAHTHTVTGSAAAAGGHTHTINDPGHAHSISPGYMIGNNEGSTGRTDGNQAGVRYGTQGAATGITINSVADHTHTITATAASVGSGTSFENRPPYYALAYIMKV